MRNWSLMTASTNVVLGDSMAQRLMDQGILPEKIRVIPNWADGDQIRPIDPENNVLRSEWMLDGKFVVGYSGNLGRAHEINTILGAAELLRDEKQLAFLVTGGGALHQVLKEKVQRRQLGNVVFKPYQPRERLAESISASDMHLISLKPELEGLIVPSKFYGIAAAGRCCVFIGDPEGELAKFIGREGIGFSISVSDSQSLAGRIMQMIRDRALLRVMGQKAREVFESRFSKSRAVDAWYSLIRDFA
jgi:glycosyltransferase involved in cell wall biosynthesis